MAVGGPFIFIPSFHLANAFPRRSGLILSMLTGAFDSSSAVFLLYRMLYEKLGRVTLEEWFLGYLIVPALILLLQLFVMPNKSYKTAGELVQQASVEYDFVEQESNPMRRDHHEDILSEIDSLLGGPEEDWMRKQGIEQKRQTAGVWGVMHGKSVSAQLGSFWFWGIAGFTIIQMVCNSLLTLLIDMANLDRRELTTSSPPSALNTNSSSIPTLTQSVSIPSSTSHSP
jgi:hypothetical protein